VFKHVKAARLSFRSGIITYFLWNALSKNVIAPFIASPSSLPGGRRPPERSRWVKGYRKGIRLSSSSRGIGRYYKGGIVCDNVLNKILTIEAYNPNSDTIRSVVGEWSSVCGDGCGSFDNGEPIIDRRANEALSSIWVSVCHSDFGIRNWLE
jgi:hypothetical protein